MTPATHILTTYLSNLIKLPTNAIVKIAEALSAFRPPYHECAQCNGPVTNENRWYVPPTQTLLEASAMVLIGCCLIKSTQDWRKGNVGFARRRSGRTTGDLVVGGLLVLSLLLQLCFKLAEGADPAGPLSFDVDVLFALQPCHVSGSLYAAALLTLDEAWGEWLFNVSLHYLYGTVLAMAVPDTSALHRFGEVEAFWIHHILVLLAPLYLLFRRRYTWHSGLGPWKTAVAFALLFHNLVQLPLALLSGVNINYMLIPPPGQPLVGRFYRFFMGSFQAVICFIVGRIFPALLLTAQELQMCDTQGKRASSKSQRKHRATHM
eukprot:CAMPEP_0170744852 /NCGR_PEP_ID=MMETSP0437-20130122/7996_1 /TAXON_ID=0 /ORGANISM="Sexangularia sp." /LENGTH=319 /DNA_ID=CAMNT_0011083563 /DNA_START=32 /DNA_END=989 /DNA_ORIENTATION=+